MIEERVSEFVIEKYIEINKGISISIMYKLMLIQILTLLVLQYVAAQELEDNSNHVVVLSQSINIVRAYIM